MNAEQRELWRRLTVALVMEVRAEYLAANPRGQLTHWDQIKDRMLASARTSASVSEWVTSLCRRLSLPSPGRRLSSAISELVSAVEADEADFLAWVESEYALVLALCRVEADRRRAARDEAQRQKGEAWAREAGFLPTEEE